MSEDEHRVRVMLADKVTPLHVVPLFGREHDESERCWCRPTKETRHPHTGEPFSAPLFVHKLEN